MSAGWVAGSVRARAIARRRVGAGAARALAGSDSLAAAVTALAATPYRRGVHVGQSLAEAQHGVAATLLWHHRVLAGWLPPAGTELITVLSAGFELANVDELLRRLAGRPAEPYFQLGATATAWPRLATAGSAAELRALLAASPWGDTGSDTPAAIQIGMRIAWAMRVAATGVGAAPWAAGALALLVARELFRSGPDRPGRPPSAESALERAQTLIGTAALRAASLPELARALPVPARWVLDEVDDPRELWRAEVRWWVRVEHDGFALLSRSGFSAEPVVGALAVLAADARRVRAALELAAQGGHRLEVFDAIA